MRESQSLYKGLAGVQGVEEGMAESQGNGVGT